MKKLPICGVLVLALALASAGCGGSGGGASDPGLASDPGTSTDVPAGTDTTATGDDTLVVHDDSADVTEPPDAGVDAAAPDTTATDPGIVPDDVVVPPADATDEGLPVDADDAAVEDTAEVIADVGTDPGIADVPVTTDPGVDTIVPAGFFPAVGPLDGLLVGTWASGTARTTFSADGTGVDFDTDGSKPRYCFAWTVNAGSQRLVREYKDLDGKDCDNYDDPNYAWAQWEDTVCADATRLSYDCLTRATGDGSEGAAALYGTWTRSWSIATDSDQELHEVTLLLDDDLTLLLIHQESLVIGTDDPLTDEYMYEGLWEFANGELTIVSDGTLPPMPHEGTWHPLFVSRPDLDLMGMTADWTRVP